MGVAGVGVCSDRLGSTGIGAAEPEISCVFEAPSNCSGLLRFAPGVPIGSGLAR